MNYYVNGRFLGRKTTGVERYATQLLRALDALLDEDGRGESWTILAPEGTSNEALELRNIRFRTGGRGQGHLWEQLSLGGLARDGVLVNLANSGPIRHGRSFTVIHDAVVYRMPALFSFSYRSLHQLLGIALSRRSRLGTVSQFSRTELASVLRLDPARIAVLPNGAEHLGQVPPDGRILERLGLRRDGFFLFVGSPAPHKNLARTLRAYAALKGGDRRFVVVGASKSNVFGQSDDAMPDGAIAPGRLEDAEIAALYANATALVFPSLYEGFGIPPLEAMSYACPVLASDIPPLREVCGDGALFFDPLREEAITRALETALAGGRDAWPLASVASERPGAFSWRASAAKLREEARRLG